LQRFTPCGRNRYMKNLIHYIKLASLVFLSGCSNLNLLDEMETMDTDSSETSSHLQAGFWIEELASETGGPPEPDIMDLEPPEIFPHCEWGELSPEGVCLTYKPYIILIHFSTDEPALVKWKQNRQIEAVTIGEDWAMSHMIMFMVKTPGQYPLDLIISDINNNSTELTLNLNFKDGYTVVITEVLADAIGPEPAEEFVEIANYGYETIDMSGWMIDDNEDANGNIIEEETQILPGQILVVASDNYSGEGEVLRIGKYIGTNGLKNSESESVELYDAERNIISQFKHHEKPKEGHSFQRLFAEMPDEVPDIWSAPEGMNPGAANFLFPRW
jgi:hypothetical protein